ncbi:MAG: hypothetical protein L6R39_001007 [Caloplaca ligustica]|nr:MAG: hypothetical protein L6R39_001007 [Caloplaca ligustica]
MVGRGRPQRTAALPLRTRDPKISYREQSSDTDDGDDRPDPQPSTRTLRPSRKKRRELSDEDSSISLEDAQLNGRVTSSSVLGHSRQQLAETKRTSPRANHSVKPWREPVSQGKKRVPGAKRAANGKSKTWNSIDGTVEDAAILQSGDKVPPWQELPYEILFQIFQYAWFPLVNKNFFAAPVVTSGSLLNTALLCKGFAEPALAALYYAPPLRSSSRAYKLLDLLESQNEHSYMNYRGMIKHLDVEAHGLLYRKHQGREPIELGRLLSLTPQIRTVGLHLLWDQPARHKSNLLPLTKVRGKRWAYQPGLFATLSNTDIRLLGWTWNVTLAQHSHLPDMPYMDYHRWKAFQSLKSLMLVNSDDPTHTERFVRSTSILPHLATIIFQNVNIQDANTLESLPKILQVLKFVNCPLLGSLSLAKLLRTHGSNLKELVLEHNDSLDLGFLQGLRANCPKLERIRVDLRFFNTHFSYDDSEPKFDALMSNGCIPDWPETLQRIELFHLRKWDMVDAERFFGSLTGSAAGLPDLRHIDIKASLAESNWRDRIGFRNKWISKMEKVFKRASTPPDPRLRSLAAFASHRKEVQHSRSAAHIIDTSNGASENDVRERSSRVEVDTASVSNSSGSTGAPLASKRRSTRLRTRYDDQPVSRARMRKRRKRRHKGDEGSSSEEDSALEDLGANEEFRSASDGDDTDSYIQGMCDVVRVVIDNLRPTEEHLDESYFLDDEISGDEEWNGDHDVGGGGNAW